MFIKSENTPSLVRKNLLIEAVILLKKFKIPSFARPYL